MKMNRTTQNLIEELDRFIPQRDKHQIVEARASNVIVSAINLLQLVGESFDAGESEELSRRLLLAIKNRDPQKFTRKIREYRKIDSKRKKNVNEQQ
jgi:hypothetical protein